MYRIQFYFIDGHQLDIDVGADDIDRFLEDLGQNRAFFTKEKQSGFWLQGEKVRYFKLFKIGEPQCPKNLPSEAESASPS